MNPFKLCSFSCDEFQVMLCWNKLWCLCGCGQNATFHNITLCWIYSVMLVNGTCHVVNLCSLRFRQILLTCVTSSILRVRNYLVNLFLSCFYRVLALIRLSMLVKTRQQDLTQRKMSKSLRQKLYRKFNRTTKTVIYLKEATIKVAPRISPHYQIWIVLKVMHSWIHLHYCMVIK